MKVCYSLLVHSPIALSAAADQYAALRLYPQLALNFRFANKPTILPRGGGPDGQSPVLIPKGSGVGWSLYHLHRLESIYGPDSRVYQPQRWESGELIKKAGLGAGFVDFNAGPRACLGSTRILVSYISAVPLTSL